MGAAIWSSSPDDMRSMPAAFFLGFFDNHGLLGLREAPLWRTVEGGSRRYVDALLARLRGDRAAERPRCASCAATSTASSCAPAIARPSASTA